MIICPNLSNPEVAREFEELKQATSEQAAYHIWSLNNGNAIDKAPNGAESKLFLALLEYYNGDRTKAIQAKAKTYGNSFLTWFGDWTGNYEESLYSDGVTKEVQDNGKIRLSLPTHTEEHPRQIVLEPQGDNKYYVHMRIWDDVENKIPGDISNEDKNKLFNALYKELPAGAEILFPKSGDGYYGTRGTVAGLMRLAKDKRFDNGSKGILLYKDKDGSIKEYEGTSFIKADMKSTSKVVDENGEPLINDALSNVNQNSQAHPDVLDKLNKKSITNQLIKHLKSIGINVHNRQDMIKYLRERGLAGLLKFIGRKARTKFEQQLRKARPDMSDAEIQSTLDFLHSLEDNKENTAYIKTAIRWVANRSITLPQDNTKARQAFDLARKKHIDIQKYNTLGELITSDEMKPKEKEKKSFDPDTAKTFSNKRTVTTEGGRVFTVYDVENTEEGQREVCKALAAHYKMSPWCLSTFTATGEPTQSAKYYWLVYNEIPRKIAFENGKPVAFSSNNLAGSYQSADIRGERILGDEQEGYYITTFANVPLSTNVLQMIREGLLKKSSRLVGYYDLTEKGLKEANIPQPKTEAWWDMDDRYPQDALTDSIVSDNSRVQNDILQLPVDPEAMNDWWQQQQEMGPEDFQDPEEMLFSDVYNSMLDIVRNEITSILNARNLVPANGNVVWYTNMLSDRYIDRINYQTRANEIIENQAATGYEIAQTILAENNIFDNIRSTIEQEIENLPQPALPAPPVPPVNPDAYGLYTRLDRYSDEYLENLINESLDAVEVETARRILQDREDARNAGDYLPFFTTPDGEVYGFVTPNGDIYLDETKISPEHPIHEYTHLWDAVVYRNNRKLWDRGVRLMKLTSEWKSVLNDDNYGKKWLSMSNITDEKLEFLVASEVHARLSGINGELILNRIASEQGNKNIILKLREWMLDVWKSLKSTFSNWSKSDIQNLTLEDFNNMVVRDLVNGNITDLNFAFNIQFASSRYNNTEENRTIIQNALSYEVLNVYNFARKRILALNKLKQLNQQLGTTFSVTFDSLYNPIISAAIQEKNMQNTKQQDNTNDPVQLYRLDGKERLSELARMIQEDFDLYKLYMGQVGHDVMEQCFKQ